MITNARYPANYHYPTTRYYGHDQRSLLKSLAVAGVASTLVIVGYLIYMTFVNYSQRQMIDNPPMSMVTNAATPTFVNTPFSR